MKLSGLIVILCSLPCILHAEYVCMLDLTGLETASYISSHESVWGVGTDCKLEPVDHPTELCKTLYAGGETFCAKRQWNSPDFDETTGAAGLTCFCRLKYLLNGTQLNSVDGIWVELGGFDTEAECNTQCPKYCIDNITHNVGGMRNALMLLSE